MELLRRIVNPGSPRDADAALIRIYLNDHRGGAAGGIALARRSEQSNRGSALGRELEAIVADFESDAATLTAIAERLSVTDDPLKRVLARTGEVVGRLKLNGRVKEYSPLSRLLELELLIAGIDAKRSLWRSLSAMHSEILSEFDFDVLEQRASEQRARLIPFHVEAAHEALVSRALRSDLAASS